MATDSLAVVHDTVVLERSVPFQSATVFAAFADTAQRARWSFPGDDWELEPGLIETTKVFFHANQSRTEILS